MTSYVTPKINTEYIFYVGLQSQADTKLLQANPTLATGDVKVSIDGGAFANLTTLPVVTPAAGKSVKVTLSAAEMNGDNITVLFSDAADAEWCDLMMGIQTTANQVDDLALASALTTAKTVVDAILIDTDTTIPGLINDLNDITAAAVVTAIMAEAIETGFTLKETLRLISAATAGKLSGAATATNLIRNMADTKTRITATVDEDGNRTAVSYDKTD